MVLAPLLSYRFHITSYSPSLLSPSVLFVLASKILSLPSFSTAQSQALTLSCACPHLLHIDKNQQKGLHLSSDHFSSYWWLVGSELKKLESCIPEHHNSRQLHMLPYVTLANSKYVEVKQKIYMLFDHKYQYLSMCVYIGRGLQG